MEAPKREAQSSRKNAAVLCSCGQPARLVVVPTSYMPGQRCWRCANPHVQCHFCLWHGPWVTERSNIEHNQALERERGRAAVSGGSTEASASSTTAETAEESKNQGKS